jgi:NTP pyrophosphatase (non-canonical NTP hydrolase)
MPKAQVRTKTLSLPRPNNLQPSLESAALQLMRETGELAGAITQMNEIVKKAGSRQQGLPGVENDIEAMAEKRQAARQIADELLDVAQTAVTMMFVIEEDYGVNLEEALEDHVKRLIEKGYIKLQSN